MQNPILYIVYSPDNLSMVIKIASELKKSVHYDHEIVLAPSLGGFNDKQFIFCSNSILYTRDVHATLCNVTEIVGLSYDHETGKASFPEKSVFLVEYDRQRKKPIRSIWIGGVSKTDLEDIYTFVPNKQRNLHLAALLAHEASL
jgi:hypothetical protein